MMDPEKLTTDLEQLDAWLAQFPEPQPSTDRLDAVRLAVQQEVSRLDWQQPRASAPSVQLRRRIKAAVRSELLVQAIPDPQTTGRFLPLFTSLATAAMLALIITALSLQEIRTTADTMDVPFTIDLAVSSELTAIQADIEQLELRVYASDYLLSMNDPEPDELLEALERISTPDYQIEFD